MASAVTAFKNITSDPFWFVKIAILAIPIYYYLTDTRMIMAYFGNDIVFWAILSLFYLGVSSVLINRNVKNKTPILPGLLDVFDVIIRVIGSFIAALPGITILFGVIWAINIYLTHLTETAIYALQAVSILVIFPFICIPVVIYSVNANLLDLFRTPKIMSASGDFIVSFLVFLIQYVFTIGLFSYLLCVTFQTHVGKGFIGIPILISFIVTLTYLMIFSWASDLYGQTIPEIEVKQKNDNKKKNNKLLNNKSR